MIYEECVGISKQHLYYNYQFIGSFKILVLMMLLYCLCLNSVYFYISILFIFHNSHHLLSIFSVSADRTRSSGLKIQVDFVSPSHIRISGLTVWAGFRHHFCQAKETPWKPFTKNFVANSSFYSNKITAAAWQFWVTQLGVYHYFVIKWT